MADNTATYIEDGEKKTGTVSSESTSYWQGVADRYKQQLEAQQQASADQLALTREAAQSQLTYDIDQANQSYQDLNKQLYLDRMSTEKNLPQQLAAYGITGGAAESSLVGVGNNYASNLAANEQQRIAAEAALRQTAAQNDYSARAAQISADAEALQNYYANQNALYEAQYNQKLQEAATREAAGDFSLSVELGLYTQEEADRLYKIWAFNNKSLAAAVDGTGTGSGTPAPKKLTADEVLEEAKTVYEGTNGSASDVRAYLKENQSNFTAAEYNKLYQKAVSAGLLGTVDKERK